jgi:hypothetical protein
VRILVLLTLALLSACDSQPPAPRDETQAAWYAQVLKQVAAINREAVADFESGKPDDAAKLIQEAQPMVARLLAVPKPSLAANEAASDLTHLYGRMLLSNRHFGWARLQFQQNLSRWKHWEPQTDDTRKRVKEAEAGIAECDKHVD